MNINLISNLELMKLASSNPSDHTISEECMRRFLLPYQDKPKHDRIMQCLSTSLAEAFGNDLQEIYLYGSRARYDHKPYSDMDVAVILRQTSIEADDILNGVVAALSVSEDIVIHAYALSSDKFNDPELQNGLYGNIHKEGIKYYG